MLTTLIINLQSNALIAYIPGIVHVVNIIILFVLHYYGRPMEHGRPLYFALWLLLSFFFLSSFFLFFPRLISAAADWMSTILPHMV